MAPSATELYEMIREAAYYRAEKRGFEPGLEAEDWAQAEAEVMARVRRANGAASAGAETTNPISTPSDPQYDLSAG